MANSLLRVLDPLVILRECGVSINSVSSKVRCPFCHEMTFSIYHESDETHWTYCEHCKFSGDLVQVYEAYHQIMTIRSGLERLGRTVEKLGGLSDEVVTSYCVERGARKRALSHWSDTATKYSRYLEGTDHVKSMYNMLKLDMVIRPNSMMDVTDFFGIATAEELADLQGQSTPPNAHAQIVVSPLYDRPGRLVGHAAYRRMNGELRVPMSPIVGGHLDTLLFLDAVRPYEAEVFLLGDLASAASLQSLSYLETGKRVPVLGFSASTSPDTFSALYARSAIFWDNGYTDRVFIAARSIHTVAKIASLPCMEDNRRLTTLSVLPSVQEVLGAMRRSALPYVDALREHLLRLKDVQVLPLLEQLKLTDDMRRQLMDCPEGVKQKLELLIHGAPCDKKVSIGPGIVSRRDGALYLYAGGRSLLASKAIPEVHKYITFPSGAIHVAGDVLVAGERIPYSVPMDDFTSHWLSVFCGQHGHLVTLHSGMKANFLHNILELQHQPPTHETGTEYPGWDDKYRVFRFRQCLVNGHGQLENVLSAFSCGAHPTDWLSVSLASDAAIKQPERGMLARLPYNIVHALLCLFMARALDMPLPRVAFAVSNFEDDRRLHSILSRFCPYAHTSHQIIWPTTASAAPMVITGRYAPLPILNRALSPLIAIHQDAPLLLMDKTAAWYDMTGARKLSEEAVSWIGAALLRGLCGFQRTGVGLGETLRDVVTNLMSLCGVKTPEPAYDISGARRWAHLAQFMLDRQFFTAGSARGACVSSVLLSDTEVFVSGEQVAGRLEEHLDARPLLAEVREDMEATVGCGLLEEPGKWPSLLFAKKIWDEVADERLKRRQLISE